MKGCGNKRILGIGVAVVGQVDIRSSVLVATSDFYGITDWDIKSVIENKFSFPVYVINDMNAASLAESFYGAARGMTDFIYLGITQGIGAGIIINDQLLEGRRGFAGEIGHISINNKGKKCSCGNIGCIELYLSVPALLKSSKTETWDQFLQMNERDVTNPHLKRLINDLSIVLINIINIFEPQAVIIGHEGAFLNSYCFDKLQIRVDEQTLARKLEKVNILPSMLGNNVSCLSAPAFVFSLLFQGIIDV
jgi:predicted NBD/HSP70 family sugar kinase